MIAVPRSCAVDVASCNDVVDLTPVIVGVTLVVLVVLAALILIGVRRFMR